MADTTHHKQPSGMRAFTIIWLGQFLSLLGTGISRFAITLWAWELTGQATALALVAFFGFAPVIIMSPIAGALVDRWKNRKLVMMLSDLSAGMVTVVYFFLSLNNGLEIWHLYVGSVVVGVFESFQFPAYSAAISTMVDKKQYGRTSAMLSLADSASGVLAPIAGAALYGLLQLRGVLLLDIISFLFALVTLMIVFIPQAETHTEATDEGKGSLLKESLFGFRYIAQRPSLLGLQFVFFFGNMVATIAGVLLSPMILSRTGSDEFVLATVNAVFGVGGVVGGLMMSLWGGPKRRIHGVLMGWLLSGLLGTMVLGIGQALPVWVIGAFATSFMIPIVNASNQAIWMSKVPPHMQGRVFSVRRLIAQVTSPIALLIAGPLADYVFEPMMRAESGLVDVFAPLVGRGPGAGIALMTTLSGLLIVVIAIGGYLTRAVREVEAIIPDHGTKPAAVPDTPADEAQAGTAAGGVAEPTV